MVNKKAQMGNMLHLVIIAVVILIAAMAIILMVTKTTGDVGESSGHQIDDASGGIGDALGSITRGCPGDSSVTACHGHIYKITGTDNNNDGDNLDAGDIGDSTSGSAAAGFALGEQVCCTSKTLSPGTNDIAGSCEYIYTCNPTS
ncbi:MAG: hypothetical protein DRN66_03675 [Candidatus Nanohalarchaeota archaeon]|nr:MAG: hypothetical protein DRN66_03675 [Candidatus Nanohaloarchaeota archaeon]